MIALKSIRLPDPVAEQVRQNTTQAIAELQQQPAASMQIVGPVSLPDGSFVLVAHQLGRKPSFIAVNLVDQLASTASLIQIQPSGFNGQTFDETKYFGVMASFTGGATLSQSFLVL